MTDDQLMQGMASVVKDLIAKATTVLRTEIAQLEARLAAIPAGPAGPAGEKGAEGSAGKDGNDGAAGASVDEAALMAMVKAACAEEAALIPQAKDGTNGRDGIDGQSVDVAKVAEMIAREVALLPKALDGRDGRDGQPGSPGAVAKDGAPGVDGKDGADGFALEDFAVALSEDDRTLKFTFSSGETVKSHEVTVPWPLDRGVYKSDHDYTKGDGVSFNGSWFIAQTQTKDRPETSPAWRLATKRGRDGKDGEIPKASNPEPVRLK